MKNRITTRLKEVQELALHARIPATAKNAVQNAYDMAIQIVEEEADGWIPVEERLPENDTQVLVQWRKYFSDEICIHILALNTLGEWYCDSGCINGKAIAWQPLPEPYHKGE